MEQLKEKSFELWDLISRSDIIVLGQDELLYKEGDPNQYLYYLQSGSLKISKDEWTVGVLYSGEIVGVISCLNGIDNYRFTTSAIETSILYKIDRVDFNKLIRSDVQFSKYLINVLCKRSKMIDGKILNFIQCSPKYRLIFELLFNSKAVGNSGVILLKTKELAELTGVRENRIKLILKELTTSRHIQPINNNYFQIIDSEGLQMLLKRCR